MIPATVEYRCARSLEDALEALTEPDATALAGGQSLLPVMKLRIARPRLVVDIGRLELRGVISDDDSLQIGALTVWDELARSPELSRPSLAGIVDCAQVIGDLQVRNRGTIGGSLAHADPSSDMPAVLLALGATLTMRSPAGTRSLSLAQFFLGPFTTALEQGELITEIVVPSPPPGSGSAYAKVEHPASGFAVAGVAAFVRPDGTRSVAVTGVGAQPFLLPDGDLDSAIAGAEVFGDDYAPTDYRRHLVSVLSRGALERATTRAEEDARWSG